MVKTTTIIVVLTLALSYNWVVRQHNVNNTFLNGVLDKDMYMTQANGFVDQCRTHFVCKLHNALYGLKQAPRDWFIKLNKCLLKWGFLNFHSDIFILVYAKQSHLVIFIVYVDDIIIIGSNQKLVQAMIDKLHKTFSLKDLGSLSFFIGIEAVSSYKGFHLSHQRYIHQLIEKAQYLKQK